ncbi:MAG: diguanylate cyclase [Gammaproteobacteria bacterium]|nr:diguanylate cyclase [Gammaproteobacteria bacterium]
MQRPEIPPHEDKRLAALASLGIINSPAEERFDRVTELAQRLFDVPIALVSLVTADTQWSKSLQGSLARETPRELSFCAHAILRKDALFVPDALQDPAFAANPLVVAEPGIRFYAGCPLRHRGQAIGTLCLMDHKARSFDAEQARQLRNLADIVENEFRLQELDTEQNRLLKELDESMRQVLMDPVTGTWNRHGIDEILPRELGRAARGNDAIAILLVDLEYVTAGSATADAGIGDDVLREVSRRLRRCVRPHDVFGLFTAREFLVFLGKCPRRNAIEIGQRMVSTVHTRPVETRGGDVECSLSIGIYSMQEIAGRSMGQIIEAADQALHQARAAGRNQLAHY